MQDYTYKDNAENYNKVEDIPGEKAMLIAGADALDEFAEKKDKISIFDVCCGTELIFNQFSEMVRIKIAKFTGVDISAEFLEEARRLVAGDPRFTFVEHDAVTYQDGNKYDVIIASSAYHHIEDERKLMFLENLKRHLAEDGVIIFLENILPLFRNEEERKSSAVEFYSRRIIDCIDNYQIRDERLALLSRVMQYERDREYEYKSHYWLFLKHLKQVGLKVIKKQKVWPQNEIFLDNNTGDDIFIVEKI